MEKIDVPFNKLEENHVNTAAITDYDLFDYDVYDALRCKVDNARYLQLVLPGVEFTAGFKTGEGIGSVHVVTLFDDSNSIAVRKRGRRHNSVPNRASGGTV